MDTVRLNRDALLTKIKENRVQHEKAYLEAMVGFKKEVTEELEEHLELAKSGKEYNLNLNLTEPQSYLSWYDQIITMLEMCIDETIELPEHDFKRYVMDDWEWKQSFASTTSFYNTTNRILRGKKG